MLDKPMRTLGAILIPCFLILFAPGNSEAYLYTVKSKVNLTKGPGIENLSERFLDHNQTLLPLGENGRWLEVATLTRQKGYVHRDMLSDRWIRIYKKERLIQVLKGPAVMETYRAALCPFNPLGDKVKQGDGGTPEGRFYLCEMIREPWAAKYGARSMRLSYPNIEDARRGLKSGLIDRAAYLGIVRDIKAGRMPNQHTKLGSSIRIHGGGSESDWTLGCIGMDDPDVVELYGMVTKGTRVEVYRSIQREKELIDPDFLNRKILTGAKKQLDHPAVYTAFAAGLIRLDYPMGDIPENHAVCTDIIIRALRNAGLDLQALLHEDVVTHPRRYRHLVSTPNSHIDHRRTRNLNTYFKYHFKVLNSSVSTGTGEMYKPGDIIIMDTGIANGTIYDHIGIASDTIDDQKLPEVINIWTTGYRTNTMDLLGKQYPEAVGHFRATHLFDYQ